MFYIRYERKIINKYVIEENQNKLFKIMIKQIIHNWLEGLSSVVKPTIFSYDLLLKINISKLDLFHVCLVAHERQFSLSSYYYPTFVKGIWN